MEGDRKITVKKPLYDSTVRDDFGNPLIPYEGITLYARRQDRGSIAGLSLDASVVIGNSDHVFECRQLPVISAIGKDWILIDEYGKEHEIVSIEEIARPGAQMRGGYFRISTIEKVSG